MTGHVYDDVEQLRLNAYCDGELDPISAVEFERRMANDEVLKAQYIRLLSLRRAIRSIPMYAAPRSLPASIHATLDAERPVRAVRPLQRRWSLQALAAAAAFGAVIATGVMLTMDRYDSREDIARQVVAGHIRLCRRNERLVPVGRTIGKGQTTGVTDLSRPSRRLGRINSRQSALSLTGKAMDACKPGR